MWSTFAQTAKSFADDFSMLVNDDDDHHHPGVDSTYTAQPDEAGAEQPQKKKKETTKSLEQTSGQTEAPHKTPPRPSRSRGASQNANPKQDARQHASSPSKTPQEKKSEPTSSDLENLLGSPRLVPTRSMSRQPSLDGHQQEGKAARSARSRGEKEIKPLEKVNVSTPSPSRVRRSQPSAEQKPSVRKLGQRLVRADSGDPPQKGSSTKTSVGKATSNDTSASSVASVSRDDTTMRRNGPSGKIDKPIDPAGAEDDLAKADSEAVAQRQQHEHAEANLRLQNEILALKKELESSKASSAATLEKQMESNSLLENEIETLRKELDSSVQDYHRKAEEASKLKSNLKEREQNISALEFKCEELQEVHSAEMEKRSSNEKDNAKRIAKRIAKLKQTASAQKSLKSSLESTEKCLGDLEDLLAQTVTQLPLSMEKKLAQSLRTLFSQYADEISFPSGSSSTLSCQGDDVDGDVRVKNGARRPEEHVVVGQAVPPANSAVREEVSSAELQHEKQKVKRLSDTNDELLAEIEDLEKQLRDKEAQTTSLENQLKEKAEAEAEQQQLESELKDLQDKYRAQCKANDRLESEMKAALKKLEEERKESEESGNSFEKEKSKTRSLSVQVSSLSQKVSIFEKEIADLECARDKALADLETSEENRKIALEAAQGAEEDLIDEREKAGQLEAQYKEHIALLEARLEESEDQIDSEQSEMRERIKELEKQIQGMATLREELESAQKAKEDAQSEIQRMEEKIQGMKAEIAEKESLRENRRAEADQHTQDLENQLRVAVARAEQAEDAYQELMSKSEEKNRRFAYIQKESTTREAEMRQSVADAEVMISSLTTEKQELRSALDAVTKSEEELKRRCEEIERNAKAAETKQNGETLALKGEHAKEIDSLKSSARKELEEQVSEATRRMQSIQDEMQQDLEAKIQKAVERAEQAEKDLAASQTQLAELQSRTSNTASSLEELSVKCTAIEAEKEKWKSAVSEAESRCQALASEKRSLEAKLRQVNDAALSLVEENTRLSEASKPYEEIKKEMAEKVGTFTAKIKGLEQQVAQWKETCESMKADRQGLISKSAVDDERKSLLRRVEELDASLFDTQSLSQRLESELEEAKERIDQLSQSGLASDENRHRYSTGDHQHGTPRTASYRTRIPKAELEKQKREFEEKKLDKLRSNGLRMARLIKKWSKGRAKVEYEKQVYTILEEGESSTYPTVNDRIRALDAICNDMQKELKVWFKR